MPRKCKTCRKADTKCNNIGSYSCCDNDTAIYWHVVFMKDEIIGEIVNEDVKQCISTTACQVPEGLERQYTCKGFIKKINDPYYDISRKCKQSIKLTAKVQKFIKYIHCHNYIYTH